MLVWSIPLLLALRAGRVSELLGGRNPIFVLAMSSTALISWKSLCFRWSQRDSISVTMRSGIINLAPLLKAFLFLDDQAFFGMKGFAIRGSGLGSSSECTEYWLDCFSNATAGPKHGHDTHALHGLGLSYPINNPVRHADQFRFQRRWTD